jgi:hypothetical protein
MRSLEFASANILFSKNKGIDIHKIKMLLACILVEIFGCFKNNR